MGRIGRVIGAGGLALAAAEGSGGAAEDPLGALRWTSRAVVVSAASADDPDLRAQRAAVAAARGGFTERDLVLIEAVGPGAEAVALRRRLGLPGDGFRAVLVGKDGGVKLRADRPIPTERLFATVDAMPMRRDEMRGRR